ncbi:MAG: NUDIX domain-containing protein [Fibrobacterales bacterium]
MYHSFQFSPTEEEEDLIVNGTLLNDWLKGLDPEIVVQGLNFQSADFIQKKGAKHLLFLKLDCDAVDEQGRRVNGIVMLRGGAVGCFIVLHCENDKYILYVEQSRIGVGMRRCPEIPAGMLDHSSDYEGIMRCELEEEADLKTEPGELVDLTKEVLGMDANGIYCSVGGMDEFLRIFLLERTVDRSFIDAYHNKHRIHDDEDEVIQIKIAPYTEARKTLAIDAKNICAFYLYEEWSKSHE